MCWNNPNNYTSNGVHVAAGARNCSLPLIQITNCCVSWGGIRTVLMWHFGVEALNFLKECRRFSSPTPPTPSNMQIFKSDLQRVNTYLNTFCITFWKRYLYATLIYIAVLYIYKPDLQNNEHISQHILNFFWKRDLYVTVIYIVVLYIYI